MRVCLVTNQFASPFSGVGTYAKALASGLVSSNVDVTVLCPSDQRDNSKRISFIPMKGRPKVGSHARWLELSVAMRRCLGKNPPFDIVHFLDAREALAYGGHGPTVVGTVHDYYFTRPWDFWKQRNFYPDDWWRRLAYSLLVHLLEPRAYSRAQTLITNSEATKTRISAAYGIPSSRSKTVYIGIHQPGSSTIPPIEERESAVLFVGGNLYRKGLPRLMKSVSELRLKYRDLELWVVGSSLPDTLQILSDRLKLGKSLKIFQSLESDELAHLYRRASVFALPGVTEAFGLVFLEAMSLGCPVIAPEDGGAGEIIENGKTGFLISSSEDDLLSTRLTELLSEPILHHRIGHAGRNRSKTFSPERMVAETLDWYGSTIPT